MQQPRQARQSLVRGAGRTSSTRSSAASLVADDDVTSPTGALGDAPTPQAKTKASTAAMPLLKPKPLLPKAPARWKAPVGKLMAAKGFAGSALPDERAAADAAATKQKEQQDLRLRWYVGCIYCGFGIFDITCRVIGVILWKIRFNGTPRLSDTQRFEVIGNVVNTYDLWRLVIVGAAAVIRCIVNLLVLWPAFGHLRPSWMSRSPGANSSRLMRYICPLFRGLLVLWCLSDFLQACVPDIPPDPSEHRILTAHIVFHQIAWISCGLTNCILFIVLFHDREAGDVFVVSGSFSLAIMVSSFIYYDVALFRGESGKSSPMGWALAVETSALMFNAGLALPSSIIAIPGTLERKSWMVRFLRLGKVRPGEDTSARTGSKPLLVEKTDNRIVCKHCGKIGALDSVFCRKCGKRMDAESEGSRSDDDVEKTKQGESSSSPEDELIKKQRAELDDLNAKIKLGKYGRGRKAAKDSTKEARAAPPVDDQETPSQEVVATHDPYAP